MRDSWLTLVDRVLRPERPHLERCVKERERHVAERRVVTEQRRTALAHCEARIESARTAVFAANDGKVTSQMTELEREWRALARPDPDAGLMDLWARVAPRSWIDRKRWHGSEPAHRLDAAIVLAADVDGVTAAESAIDALHRALVAGGTPIGGRIRWRALEHDADCTVELLAEPLRAARAVLAAHGVEAVVVGRAEQLERDVHDAARARFPERPLLAQGVAHAAFVDVVWRAAALAGRANPVTALRELWTVGYVLAAFDAAGVTVQFPSL